MRLRTLMALATLTACAETMTTHRPGGADVAPPFPPDDCDTLDQCLASYWAYEEALRGPTSKDRYTSRERNRLAHVKRGLSGSAYGLWCEMDNEERAAHLEAAQLFKSLPGLAFGEDGCRGNWLVAEWGSPPDGTWGYARRYRDENKDYYVTEVYNLEQMRNNGPDAFVSFYSAPPDFTVPLIVTPPGAFLGTLSPEEWVRKFGPAQVGR